VEGDRAVIIVTHDSRIFEFADTMAHMDDGQIVSLERQTPRGAPTVWEEAFAH
jgi:putative ABC transport system ATP-binding protein